MASKSNPITQTDLENVDTFLRDLKARAGTYHDQGNVVMLGIVADLVKVVSPRVTRLHARYERESLAAVNRDHKALKKTHQQNGATPAS